MASVSCEGVVLRLTRYSETSLIVVAFTRERGRVEALAKGARRPKSPMAGHLDILNRCALLLIERPRSGLDLLTEAVALEESTALRARPAAFAIASLAAEILLAGCLAGDPHPAAYAAWTAAAARLGAGAPPRAEGGRLLLAVLADLGLAPSLRVCAGCGEELGERTGGRFAPARGGLLCETCGAEAEGVDLDPATAHRLRRLAAPEGGRAAPPAEGVAAVAGHGSLSSAPAEVEILDLLAGYAEFHLERPLRARTVVRALLRPADAPPRATPPGGGRAP